MKSILVLWLVLVAPCFARIGENMEACVKRYGQPVAANPNDVLRFGMKSFVAFKKEGIMIYAVFISGKVEKIVFMNASRVEGLSDEEKNSLLRANAGGSDWVPDKHTDDTWVTRDRSRIARGDFGGGLVIETAKYIAQKQAEEASDDAKKKSDVAKRMKGF